MAKHFINVGMSKTGKPLEIDISNPIGAGLLGRSRSGKSIMLLNILSLLAKEMRDRVQFVAFDMKLSSVLPFVERLAIPVVDSPESVLSTMMNLEQIMLNRYSDMRSRHITKIDPWDEELTKEYPQIVVVFEELLSICNNSDLPKSSIDSIKRFFLTYTTRAKAANMGYIFCSHTYSQTETISVAARGQLDTRMIFACGVNENQLFAEGSELPRGYELNNPGELYLATGGNFSCWTKGKTFCCTDEKYEQIAKSYAIDVRDIGMNWSVQSPFD